LWVTVSSLALDRKLLLSHQINSDQRGQPKKNASDNPVSLSPKFSRHPFLENTLYALARPPAFRNSGRIHFHPLFTSSLVAEKLACCLLILSDTYIYWKRVSSIHHLRLGRNSSNEQ
jgi:hypothetical protein